MFIGYVIVAALLALASAGSAFATFSRNPQVVSGMTKVGVPDSWLPWLATAKAAGALGLLAGLAVAPLGVAAAVGLVLYFVGAVISHVRVKDFAVAPVVVLTLLAAAALVLRIASA
ncbi:DoxX family protein [Streptomyces xanthii]|uniref:DoxX family protein n=1 Tax=Streptomyces xanthii TaxID=2768069 RepID=A0A7H1BG24_9ACTN|nr:DoxX family protein [Streptomyces xanthii]QNS07679.1 DoxX family protein [Streptomyces xanthii]